MNEKLKNKILVVVVVLMAGFCLMAFSSNQTVAHIKEELNQERYKRMVAEENLNKVTLRAGTLEADLNNAREKLQSIQTIIQEGKLQTLDLKTQLESVIKAKEVLEKKIEELKGAAAAVEAKAASVPAPAPTP